MLCHLRTITFNAAKFLSVCGLCVSKPYENLRPVCRIIKTKALIRCGVYSPQFCTHVDKKNIVKLFVLTVKNILFVNI